jgi:small subunit ribosomal protein S16
MGKKKQPVYKVVAADSRSPRDGKFLEAIGLYNPLTNPHTVEIKEDRAMYWLNVGAQPTYTVKSLLKQKGLLLKRELLLKGLPEERIAVELENWGRLREAKVMSGASKKKSAVKKESQKTGKEEIENGTAEVKGAASEDTSSGEK